VLADKAEEALVDLFDDEIGRCAVHVDPRTSVDVENFAEALDAFRGVNAQAGFPDHGYFSVGIGLI